MNRKTIFLKTAFLLACLITGTFIASAYTCEVDGIYYNLSSGKATVTYRDNNYSSYSGDVVIPEVVTYNGNTYPVTSIGDYAFSRSVGLTSLTVPNSITTIGSQACSGCTNLTRINITDLEAWCNIYFSYNPLQDAHHLYLNGSEVTELVIPNSITNIRSNAFQGCTGLTSVTIPTSVTIIGSSVFYGCSNLTSISIPNSVTSIGNYAFKGCTSLVRVNITDVAAWCGITFGSYDDLTSNPLYLSHRLYLNGTEVTNLVIPNTATVIKKKTFAGCSGLRSVTIPNSVTEIGESAFSECDGLMNVSIGNSVKKIESSAFSNCTSLTNLTIPNSVTYIGYSAFAYCSGLTSVILPNSITAINQTTFYKCTSLSSISIPNSVILIGDFAFFNCSSLTSVTLGNSVTTIGYSGSESGYAFAGCSNLTSITIPNSVTSIGWGAFSGCSGLTSVTMGNSVTTVGKKAFENCNNLTRVNISDLEAWCKISFYFNNVSDYCSNPLYAAHHLYLNGTEVTNLVIPSSITEIKQYAFYGGSGFTSVTIPNSITSIGGKAFSGCSPTQLIWNAKNCDWIGSMTTSKITQVTIGPEVEVLPSYFVQNSLIESVEIPNSVTTIETGAFKGCKALTEVDLGSGVITIGQEAFNGCNLLTSVTSRRDIAPTMVKENCFSTYNIATLYIPIGATDDYQLTDYWYKFANIVEKNFDVTPGDVNGDGIVNISDVTSLIDKLLNDPVIDNPAADMNGDGIINITDVTIIIDHLLNS